MDTLDFYISKWGLTEPEPLAETTRAVIYKTRQNDQLAVLKIYVGEGAEHERRGVHILEICDGQGTVNVLESDDGGILMEYCDGPALDSLVKNGQDSEATKTIAGLLNKIHAQPIPENHSFLTLEERFSPLFQKELQNTQSDHAALFTRAARLAERLLSQQQELCLLHGDMHHYNVIYSSTKGWKAIDPKGYVGDRAYDTALTLLNPWELADIVRNEDRFLKQVNTLSKHMDLDPQKIIDYAFIEACIFNVWFLSQDIHSDHAFALAQIIDPLTQTKLNLDILYPSAR